MRLRIAETARSVVTVECDPERAAIARERLAGLANVEALEGDAYELLRGRGPFGLVFADGGVYDWEQIVELLAPGGLLVKDDLTPGRAVDGDPGARVPAPRPASRCGRAADDAAERGDRRGQTELTSSAATSVTGTSTTPSSV